MIFIGFLVLYFSSTVNAVPIDRNNPTMLTEGVLPGAPLTPLESEMLERKKRCNDCDPIGFIFITSSVPIDRSEPVNDSDFILLTIRQSTENSMSNDPINEESLFTSNDVIDSSANVAFQLERGSRRSRSLVGQRSNPDCRNRLHKVLDASNNKTASEEQLGVNEAKRQKIQCCSQIGKEIKQDCCGQIENQEEKLCCGNRRIGRSKQANQGEGENSCEYIEEYQTNCCQDVESRNKKPDESESNKKISNKLMNEEQDSEDQPSTKENRSKQNCTYFSDLNNITGLNFSGNSFAIICIEDHDKLGFCEPIKEIMFDCRAISTKEGKNTCCIEKFIYKFLTSFDEIYDILTKFSLKMESRTQQEAYIRLYPNITSSSED